MPLIESDHSLEWRHPNFSTPFILDSRNSTYIDLSMRLSPQTLIVLQALRRSARSWCYGYDLSKLTLIKSGTLYPLLSRLHDEGWLETRWEESPDPGRPPRHLYRLSGAGSKATNKILHAATAKAILFLPVRQH